VCVCVFICIYMRVYTHTHTHTHTHIHTHVTLLMVLWKVGIVIPFFDKRVIDGWGSISKQKDRKLFGLEEIIFIFRRVRKIAKSYYKLYHVRLSAWNNSTPTERLLTKFYI
jgi:hypothetical protein